MRIAAALATTLTIACGGTSSSIGRPPLAPNASVRAPADQALEVLASLKEEGWLDQFIQGRCRPLEEGETLSDAQVPQASNLPPVESEDIIAEADRAFVAPPRSAACQQAVTRFEALRRARMELARQTAWHGALGYFHLGIRELAQVAEDSPECPLDDPGLDGAVLAVARHRTDMAVHAPVQLFQAGRSCRVVGLAGSAWLDESSIDTFLSDRRDAARENPRGDADYPPGVAVDWVDQVCWRGVVGRADGCIDSSLSRHCRNCEAERGLGCPDHCGPRYSEVASDQPGTVTVFISMQRSALGCGSTALRSYEVTRAGGQTGEWRVRNETLLEPGNHSQ
ncbi:MAG: hypothetical protein JRH11_22110 [Deltaproteobacteria bacterium]|nr:hypothetical protein [Deltaproteobacteria bacterium]